MLRFVMTTTRCRAPVHTLKVVAQSGTLFQASQSFLATPFKSQARAETSLAFQKYVRVILYLLYRVLGSADNTSRRRESSSFSFSVVYNIEQSHLSTRSTIS